MLHQKISIILTSYNYADYVDKAITSVQAQTWADWELLVVDDGSTDASREVVGRFVNKDKRIQLLTHPGKVNRGLASSLQLGLSKAHCSLIAFLESDDYWEPECLERRLQALHLHGGDVVFNGIRLCVMPGANAATLHRYLCNNTRRFQQEGQVCLKNELVLGSVIPTFSCAMIRKNVLETCSCESPVPRWLDWWLWLQLAQTAKFIYIPDRLTVWRVHTKSYNYEKNNYLQNMDRKIMLRSLLKCLPSNVKLYFRLLIWAMSQAPTGIVRVAKGVVIVLRVFTNFFIYEK